MICNSTPIGFDPYKLGAEFKVVVLSDTPSDAKSSPPPTIPSPSTSANFVGISLATTQTVCAAPGYPGMSPFSHSVPFHVAA